MKAEISTIPWGTAAADAVLGRVDEILEAEHESGAFGATTDDLDRCDVGGHALRVLGRLGVVGAAERGKQNYSGSGAVIGGSGAGAPEAVVPGEVSVQLRVNLARHGRDVCTESAPRCGSCSLVSFCEKGRSWVAEAADGPAVVDLFGGAGAMGLGFEQAGFRIAAVVEIERNAAQTYRLNHPGVPVLEASVEDVSGDALRSWIPGLGAPAGVIAGPPCQGYSAAGARTADDRRNLLFRHVSRIARELRARSVLIENVPGLRYVNGVSYTEQITGSLRDAGYETWGQPVALRASDFGVPQNRTRLFFVGVSPGVGLPTVPAPTHVPQGDPVSDAALPQTETLLQRFQGLPSLGPGEGSERLRMPDGRVILNSTAMKHSPRVVAKIKAIPQGGGPISYRRLEDNTARTLVAGHRALPVHPSENRAITVREAARIQGFPDSYFFCGARANQPIQVANAVPPALAQAVAEALRTSLDAPDRSQPEQQPRNSRGQDAPPTCTLAAR